MPFNFEEFEQLARERGHSDDYISETIQYAQILNNRKLPVIFSTIHLAISMNLPSYVLENLIKSYNYTYFNLKKKNNSDFREIMVPNEKLKYVQRWINFNILQKAPLSNACTGFRPNYSILKNAIVHSESIAIYKVDLLRFFDTITDRRVFGLFKSLGYVDNLAFDLAQLCTSKHKKSYWASVEQKGHKELEQFYKSNPAVLPQGAPTSPTIANLIATKMDEKFIQLSHILGFRYTRYADDLTFSIVEGGRLPDLNTIKRIIMNEGFFINSSKVNYFKRGMKQHVTGLSITHGTTICKKQRKEIFKHLYFCQKYGPQNHLAYSTKKAGKNNIPYAFQDWLLGKISFIYSIDKINGVKMFREFEKINWSFDS